MIKKHPLAFLYLAVLTLAAIILSLQLPFMYYSDDVVFHAAKILAARDGDYFTDPITGYQSLYPPLFHIMAGKIAGFLGTTSFQTSRVLQLLIFLGMFGTGFLFCRVTLGDWEKAAFGGLCMSLIVYAPTGKYFLVLNPYTFSFMFALGGICFLAMYVGSRKLWQGIAGALLGGIGINTWWWCIVPLAAFMLAITLVAIIQRRLRVELGRLTLISGAFLSTALFTVWSFFQIRTILPNYFAGAPANRFWTSHGTVGAIIEWCRTFLLKGNQQFFKYLYPAAWNSTSTAVRVYGAAASAHYYLVILPFNYLMICLSGCQASKSWKAGAPTISLVVSLAAVFAFILSIAALYQDASVLRRVQFYVFIFILPGFVEYVFEKLRLAERTRLKMLLSVVPALILLYTVIYRPGITLRDPISPATSEIVSYIRGIPRHAERRIFVTEFDNHRLAREVRYRSFLLTGHPTYFWLDDMRSDTIFQAYSAIVAGGPDAESWLQAFTTEWAVIGKIPFNISPVPGKATQDILTPKMMSLFGSLGERVLENDEWVIFRLHFPFAPDSARPTVSVPTPDTHPDLGDWKVVSK